MFDYFRVFQDDRWLVKGMVRALASAQLTGCVRKARVASVGVGSGGAECFGGADLACFRTTAQVIVVFVVSFVHSCFSAYINWDLFIANFGNAPHLASSPWSFSVDPVCTAVVACIVQLHCERDMTDVLDTADLPTSSADTWRVYIIGKRSLWIPVIIAVLTLLQLGAGGVCRRLRTALTGHLCSSRHLPHGYRTQ